MGKGCLVIRQRRSPTHSAGLLSAFLAAWAGQPVSLANQKIQMMAAHSVTDQLSSSSLDLIGLMKQTNLVVDEVTRRRVAIHRLLVETTSLSQALDAIVDQTNADLGPALNSCHSVVVAGSDPVATAEVAKIPVTLTPRPRIRKNSRRPLPMQTAPWRCSWVSLCAVWRMARRCRF